MKKFVISILLICICLLILKCNFNIDKPVVSIEKIEEFNKYKSSFENVNNKILSINGDNVEEKAILNEENKERKIFTIEHNKEANNVIGILRIKDDYVDDVLNELNQINDYLKNDFEFIEFSTDRISYEGNGNHIIVYSQSGKIPNYYFYKDDTTKFTVYDLGDKWYLLINDIR